MKTKMSFKRAALPVVATLLTAVISLTGVTYAWFTSGTTATVDQIDVNVEAAGGLQISGTGAGFDWGSNYNPNINGITLKALSSTDGVNFYTAHLDDSMGKISSFTKVENGAGRDYVTFDLFFKNPSTTDKTVNISGTELAALLGGNSQYAARIAFLNMGSKSSLITGLKPGDFTETNVASGVIFEPNATDHSANGVADQRGFVADAQANGVYSYLGIKGASVSGYYYDRFTGVPYVKDVARDADAPAAATGKYIIVTPENGYGEYMQLWHYDADLVSAGTTNADVAANIGKLYFRAKNAEADTAVQAVGATGHTINVELNDYFTFKTATTYSKVNTAAEGYTSPFVTVGTQTNTADTYFTLKAQTVTKITVVLWLEGQDVDCENSTSGYGFSVNLKFNIG